MDGVLQNLRKLKLGILEWIARFYFFSDGKLFSVLDFHLKVHHIEQRCTFTLFIASYSYVYWYETLSTHTWCVCVCVCHGIPGGFYSKLNAGVATDCKFVLCDAMRIYPQQRLVRRLRYPWWESIESEAIFTRAQKTRKYLIIFFIAFLLCQFKEVELLTHTALQRTIYSVQ